MKRRRKTAKRKYARARAKKIYRAPYKYKRTYTAVKKAEMSEARLKKIGWAVVLIAAFGPVLIKLAADKATAPAPTGA